MKDIYTIKIEDQIVGMSLDDIQVNESVTFTTQKGKVIVIKSDHVEDCCEHVFADFSILKYATKHILAQEKTKEISFKGVEKMGFLMIIGDNKYFIPCYNIQNGYYSSDLGLVVIEDNVKHKVNISDFVEDDIS